MTEGLSSQLSSLPLDSEGNLVYCQPFFLQRTPGTVAKEVGVGNPAEENDRTGQTRCPIDDAGCQVPSAETTPGCEGERPETSSRPQKGFAGFIASYAAIKALYPCKRFYNFKARRYRPRRQATCRPGSAARACCLLGSKPAHVDGATARFYEYAN